MEEIPFIYGKIAIGKDFCDREKETTYLVQYFTSLINAIIISPRGWGKSSLVNKAAKLAMVQDSNLRICHIDLFNVVARSIFIHCSPKMSLLPLPQNGRRQSRAQRVSFRILFPRFQSVQTPPMRSQSTLIGRR